MAKLGILNEMFQNQLKKDFNKALKKLKIADKDLEFEHPANPEHGDYSTNIALRLKKKDIPTPFDLANQIVNTFRGLGLPEYLAKIEVEGTGFINIWLKDEALFEEVGKVLKAEEKYGSSDSGKGKTMVIDYSSPNIAKPFGIGHLRSTIIGQAVYNLYSFLGWRTIGDNHLGDWGTQFGKLIVAIKKWGGKKKLDSAQLEKLYVKFHREAVKNPELDEEARAWFKKLEEGNREAKKIWKVCVDISMKDFERIYNLLGVKIDYAYGESFYEDKMPAVIKDVKRKKVGVKSEGALVIKFSELNIPPAIVLKSDGATTYETRDLACIVYRKKRWQPDLYIYEVGAEQKLHFQQTFAAAVKLGYGKPEQFVHMAHGFVQVSSGKRMSTRAGESVRLEKVLEEAIKRARQIIKNSGTARNLAKKKQEEVAWAVGIGAIKYFDLRHHYTSDFVFDWEKMFQLEGNSAPYLQYTYARCQSILEKAEDYSLPEKLPRLKSEEVSLLRTLYKFSEVIQEASESYSPNLLCNFLFDLAQKYNLFYNQQPILKADSEESKNFRLALTVAIGQVLKNGLGLLGIESPERM
ncbi:MAG TPA: arginine--tRNA ligase [Patescibacteria group bacterium]|nr:arginine--tRNA ligase [Patescibacteria group bacterium]